ncbi:MAG: hypothetical protein JWN15_4300, partial [Firmicutes bacterium]|nr:hypothetical protein [Bacillota bacterium]
ALSGAAIQAWRAERQSFRALRPLYDLVTADNANLVLSPHILANDRWVWRTTSFHLPRRMTEIRDGMHFLLPWMRAANPGIVYDSLPDAPSGHLDQRAEAAAAALLDAAERFHDALTDWRDQGEEGQPPSPGGPSVPLPGGDIAACDEREFLVRVAHVVSAVHGAKETHGLRRVR